MALDRRHYTGFGYIHKSMGGVALFCSFLLCFAFLGFHIDSFLISMLFTAGVILWIPAVKKNNYGERLAVNKGDKDFPIPSDFESWPMDWALILLGSRTHSIDTRPENSVLLRDIVDDAKWIHDRYNLLVDYPEHKATIELIVKNYLPLEISDHHRAASQDLSRRQRRHLDELTQKDLEYLHTDVRRVRDAITTGSLNTLESHAEAIRRSLETKSTLPPDVL